MPSLQERQVLWQEKKKTEKDTKYMIEGKRRSESSGGEGMEAISRDASEVHKTIQKAT